MVDAAGLLSPAEQGQLDQLSAQVEQASGRQLVVATIADLQGYPIEEYGYRLGREWKIGQSEVNNGILLIVAPNEREVRIEVGYGLEPIMTDALSSTIIRDMILPRFRDGDMGAGIVAGAQAIAGQLRLPPNEAEARARTLAQSRPARRARGGTELGDIMVAVFWMAIIMFVVVPALFGRRRGGRRYRRGGGPVVIWGPGWGGGGGSSWGGGGSSWGGGGGGFSGGGGSFGGGGASGSW